MLRIHQQFLEATCWSTSACTCTLSKKDAEEIADVEVNFSLRLTVREDKALDLNCQRMMEVGNRSKSPKVPSVGRLGRLLNEDESCKTFQVDRFVEMI